MVISAVYIVEMAVSSPFRPMGRSPLSEIADRAQNRLGRHPPILPEPAADRPSQSVATWWSCSPPVEVAAGGAPAGVVRAAESSAVSPREKAGSLADALRISAAVCLSPGRRRSRGWAPGAHGRGSRPREVGCEARQAQQDAIGEGHPATRPRHWPCRQASTQWWASVQQASPATNGRKRGATEKICNLLDAMVEVSIMIFVGWQDQQPARDLVPFEDF